MPKIPLCQHCNEPVYVEDQEYMDLTDRYSQEEEFVHATCWSAYKASQTPVAS